MKFIIVIAILFCILSGCKDNGSTNPPPYVTIFLDFQSGFQADSVIVSSDGHRLIGGIAFSDGLNRMTGIIFYSYIGFHRVTLDLPIERIRSETTFVASTEFTTRIAAHLDRAHRIVTYDIFYGSN